MKIYTLLILLLTSSPTKASFYNLSSIWVNFRDYFKPARQVWCENLKSAAYDFKARREAEKKQQTLLNRLPDDLQCELLRFTAQKDIDTIARHFQVVNTDNPEKMCEMFREVEKHRSYKAHMCDLAERLSHVYVMRYPKVKTHLASIKKDLHKGRLLITSVQTITYTFHDLLGDKNLDLNYQDEQGKTALMHCCDSSQVSLLIGAGVNINLKDNGGNSALSHAAYCGSLPIVKELLSSGADPNNKINGSTTPLIWAAQNGNHEMVKALLNAKANPLLRDSGGYTATDRIRQRLEHRKNMHAYYDTQTGTQGYYDPEKKQEIIEMLDKSVLEHRNSARAKQEYKS